MSPGGFDHSSSSANVAIILGQWCRSGTHGRVLTNEAGIIVEVGPDTVRGADVAFISYQRLPKGRRVEGFLAVPPELVVEIIGKGQGWREIVEKVGEYLRMGVDRVWVIDPDSERLHIYRSDTEPVILERDQTIQDATVLPGFTALVTDFFAD